MPDRQRSHSLEHETKGGVKVSDQRRERHSHIQAKLRVSPLLKKKPEPYLVLNASSPYPKHHHRYAAVVIVEGKLKLTGTLCCRCCHRVKLPCHSRGLVLVLVLACSWFLLGHRKDAPPLPAIAKGLRSDGTTMRSNLVCHRDPTVVSL